MNEKQIHELTKREGHFKNSVMKKMLLATIAFVFTMSETQARPLSAIKDSGIIHVMTEGTFAPFNFHQGKELTGFEVELTNMLIADLGLKPEWKTAGFDSLLIALSQDRADLVVSSHGITDARSKVVDFLSPHYCTGGVIVTKGGKPASFADIKDKNVLVQVGTTYLGWLQKHGLKNAKTYQKDVDSMQNMLLGRGDAWVTDKFVALNALETHPKAGLLIGDMIFEERIGMAVSKGNRELREALDRALDKTLKDGRYAALSQKYFKQDIRCKR